MPHPPASADSGAPGPAQVDPSRVLIAEDDRALGELMADVMALEGYDVTLVTDAVSMRHAVHVDGIREFPVDPFDLIVTDVRMAGETGLQALARLRQTGCQIPAVVVTAFPEPHLQDEVAGLDALLLAKPFRLEDFRTIAALMLRTRPRVPRRSGRRP